ncbi:MAG: hypothetical protein JSU87_09075 [Gemmatimonadota bacterium]|nr:MAG: hypothetical protein JSU87_09075 [Gemmatimonadota bacterium]
MLQSLNRTAPMRPHALVGRRRAILLLLALLLALPTEALAQGGWKANRRWLYGLGFALAAGIPAYAISPPPDGSVCSSRTCVGLMAGSIAGFIGFLIGNELDSNYKRRMAAGPSLDYSFRNVALGFVPDRMSGFSGGAAVVGTDGARLVRRDGSVLQRGTGVRGIEDAAVLTVQDLLVLSTFSNLVSFPLESDSAAGQVIDQRGGGVMQVFQENLAVATLDSLRLLRVQRQAGDVSVETVATAAGMEFVSDMAYSEAGRLGWVLTEDKLLAVGSDLQRRGELVLPALGRRVRARGERLAVAAGASGVFVVDAADPTRPRVVLEYTGVRFAYAADLDGDLLYVAAGPEGVAVVDVSEEVPRVVGVAREVEFAADVVAGPGGEVWILDRDGRVVQIADLGSRSAGHGSGAGR